MVLDPKKLEEWRDVTESAPAGPWVIEWGRYPRYGTHERVPDGVRSAEPEESRGERDLDICETDSGVYGPDERTALFMVAAREAMPLLIAEVERLRGEVAWLAKLARPCGHPSHMTLLDGSGRCGPCYCAARTAGEPKP